MQNVVNAMKKNAHDRRLISRYMDNDLNESETLTMHNHIAFCSDCRIILDEYSTIRNLVRESCKEPSYCKKTFINKESMHKNFTGLIFPGAWIKIAAVTVCAVSLFSGFYLQTRTEHTRQLPIVIETESSRLMNTPLCSIVYYEELAGKAVNAQFAQLKKYHDITEEQTISSSKNISGYESPLFHDNDILKQRYKTIITMSTF